MGGVTTVFSVDDCLCLLKPSVSEHFLCLQASSVCHSETKAFFKQYTGKLILRLALKWKSSFFLLYDSLLESLFASHCSHTSAITLNLWKEKKYKKKVFHYMDIQKNGD